MKEGRYDYLNDEELEALIAEVEKNSMIAPPVYLKELIMEEAVHRETALGNSQESGQMDKGPEKSLEISYSNRKISRGDIKQAAKRQFWIYSFKIAAAAAMAVISLTVVPMDISGERAAEGNHIERQIEKDIERYQEAKREALEEKENKGSGLGSRFGTGIWNGLSDWLRMEE
ncbi:MAG: hypothetical protein K2P19_05095 [Kineothrix sp.]|nr:hypothetical protein [Kineothrix sp.]NBI92102.1 hypothetical protein [Lachnospiraceae bacterium]